VRFFDEQEKQRKDTDKEKTYDRHKGCPQGYAAFLYIYGMTARANQLPDNFMRWQGRGLLKILRRRHVASGKTCRSYRRHRRNVTGVRVWFWKRGRTVTTVIRFLSIFCATFRTEQHTLSSKDFLPSSNCIAD
jgi:hypothetical protein